MLLLWMGCIASEVVITGTNPDPVDSGVFEDDDSGEVGDTGDSTVDDPDPEYDLTGWSGTLQFSGNGCDDVVQEEGALLDASSSAYAACPSCDVIFSLTPSLSSVCPMNGGSLSVTLEEPTLRGLRLGSDWAAVYDIVDGEPRLLDSGADFIEGELVFSYSETLSTVRLTVSGTASFLLLD